MISRTEALAALHRSRCACGVCLHHHKVHPQAKARVLEIDFTCDADLLPLIDAVIGVGLVPTSSCAHVREAVLALDPLGYVRMARQSGTKLQMGEAMRPERGYLRFALHHGPAERLAAALASHRGFIVTRGELYGWPLAQVVFPTHEADALTEAVAACA